MLAVGRVCKGSEGLEFGPPAINPRAVALPFPEDVSKDLLERLVLFTMHVKSGRGGARRAVLRRYRIEREVGADAMGSPAPR